MSAFLSKGLAVALSAALIAAQSGPAVAAALSRGRSLGGAGRLPASRGALAPARNLSLGTLASPSSLGGSAAPGGRLRALAPSAPGGLAPAAAARGVGIGPGGIASAAAGTVLSPDGSLTSGLPDAGQIADLPFAGASPESAAARRVLEETLALARMGKGRPNAQGEKARWDGFFEGASRGEAIFQGAPAARGGARFSLSRLAPAGGPVTARASRRPPSPSARGQSGFADISVLAAILVFPVFLLAAAVSSLIRTRGSKWTRLVRRALRKPDRVETLGHGGKAYVLERNYRAPGGGKGLETFSVELDGKQTARSDPKSLRVRITHELVDHAAGFERRQVQQARYVYPGEAVRRSWRIWHRAPGGKAWRESSAGPDREAGSERESLGRALRRAWTPGFSPRVFLHALTGTFLAFIGFGLGVLSTHPMTPAAVLLAVFIGFHLLSRAAARGTAWLRAAPAVLLLALTLAALVSISLPVALGVFSTGGLGLLLDSFVPESTLSPVKARSERGERLRMLKGALSPLLWVFLAAYALLPMPLSAAQRETAAARMERVPGAAPYAKQIREGVNPIYLVEPWHLTGMKGGTKLGEHLHDREGKGHIRLNGEFSDPARPLEERVEAFLPTLLHESDHAWHDRRLPEISRAFVEIEYTAWDAQARWILRLMEEDPGYFTRMEDKQLAAAFVAKAKEWLGGPEFFMAMVRRAYAQVTPLSQGLSEARDPASPLHAYLADLKVLEGYYARHRADMKRTWSALRADRARYDKLARATQEAYLKLNPMLRAPGEGLWQRPPVSFILRLLGLGFAWVFLSGLLARLVSAAGRFLRGRPSR